MTQFGGNVKQKWDEAREWLYNWLECHPRTIAWISLLLFINYLLDFLT